MAILGRTSPTKTALYYSSYTDEYEILCKEDALPHFNFASITFAIVPPSPLIYIKYMHTTRRD